MTTTDAEAIARIIDPGNWENRERHRRDAMVISAECGVERSRALNKAERYVADSLRKANRILSYLASRREAEPVIGGTAFCGHGRMASTCLQCATEHKRDPEQQCPACFGTGRFRGCFGGPDWPLCPQCNGSGLSTAPSSPVPAPAGETIEKLRQALGDARDEASESLRVLDAISEYVGCPHDEELTVDHVRQHYMALENAAQRQGILDAGRIANAEARAAGAPAGEVERLREALKPFADAAASYDDIPGVCITHGNVMLWQQPNRDGYRLTVQNLRDARAAHNGGRE